MSNMSGIFILGFFGLVALIHLYAILSCREWLRRITKVCLMPLLVAYYVITAGTALFTVPLGAILGWAGDVFLIKINKQRYLRLGLACFLMGHIFYILSLLYYVETVFTLPLVISAAAALPLCLWVYFFAKPVKGMRLAVIVYALVIETMSITALQLMLNRPGHWGTVIFAGSLLFVVSDIILAYFTFHTLPKRGNFFVMLPYILAQAALVTGLALI